MTESTRTTSASSTNARAGAESYPSSRALAWFLLFRLCIATGLFILFVPSPTELWRSEGPLPFNSWVAVAYVCLVLLGAFAWIARWPTKEQQIQIAVFLDIVSFTLLMHGSGGVHSSIGLLLAITVAAGAMQMEGRLSLLFASFATLGVIAQQVSAQLYPGSGSVSFTRAGLLGITFFTVATLAHVLYRRIQQTEQLAARRQVDIADLSKLNDFIIQCMDTGVVVVDQDQRLRLMNAAALQLLDLPISATGSRLTAVAPQLALWLSAQTKRPKAPPDRSAAVLVNGHEVRPSFLLLGNDPGGGMIVFLRDERELAREAQQIKLASLGRLTASIAHNIRNPLSAVSHAGQLLAESPALSAEDQRLLDIVRRNSGRIDDIIESVLHLSRRNQAAPRRIKINAWLEELCGDLREAYRLPEERLRLRVPDAELEVEMDPRHLHQVISNLCDNALKHADNGQTPVEIEIRALRDPIRRNPRIEVEDNGMGIDQQTAAEIFSPFFSNSPQGTGLGLYIAKELCETNGVELEYIAEEKRGACFRLTFPS